jgi:GNAT superfamily N-acetyltransferase
MERKRFDSLVAFAKGREYSSLGYVEYEELKESEIVVDDKTLKLLYDKSKDLHEIHYASDDLHELINGIEAYSLSGLIKFIPYDAIPIFENQGFKTHCVYQDYYLEDLNQLGTELTTNRSIRFASAADAKALSKVSKSCVGLSRGFFGETEDWFIDWLDDNKVMVRVVEDEIVGFCCVSIYAEGTTLWIRELAVSPDFQGKGIGKDLMKMGLQYGLLQGVHKSFLAVDIENRVAIQLYENLAFKAKANELEVQMMKK